MNEHGSGDDEQSANEQGGDKVMTVEERQSHCHLVIGLLLTACEGKCYLQ